MRYSHLPRLMRLNLAIIVSFFLVAVTLTFWSAVRNTAILQREDNPRLVEAELRVQRGRVLDANGLILAETIGLPGGLRRHYPLPYAGPAVGYYSLRYGTAGIEEGADLILRGTTADPLEAWWRQFTHTPQVGQAVRLTLDGRLQKTGANLLSENKGAIVLLSLNDQAIRVMLSHPPYDPDQFDQTFDALVVDEAAPLLNRVTQGQYQPGLVLQPFIIAKALEQGVIQLNQEVKDAAAPVTVNGTKATCALPLPNPTAASWGDIMRHACPAPMLMLGNLVGADNLRLGLQDFGFTTAPSLPIATAEPDPFTIDSLPDALIGQDELTVTPMQVALALASLAQDGQALLPRLVAAVEDANGEWIASPFDPTAEPRRVLEPGVASNVLAQWSTWERATEFVTLTLAGPDNTLNGWYLGLAPANAPRFAIVVVVEDVNNVETARDIGRGLLTAALNSR